jgi:hypothetical protein
MRVLTIRTPTATDRLALEKIRWIALENISPVLESKALFNGLSRRLGGDARGRKGIDVDDRKSCGIATALEMQRLLVGGANVHDIACFYINSNTFR